MEDEKKEHHAEHQEHEHSEHHESVSKKNITGKIKENPWVLSTFVAGGIALVLLGMIVFGGITGNAVSGNSAAKDLVSYLNTIADSQIDLVDIESEGSMYLVTVSYQGQEIPLYITKDGKYYTSTLIPIVKDSEETKTTEIPKTDKPSAELYIWSYCPYGVTALSPFAEVAKLLKDSADFKVRLYYAGHGEYELQQNKIQACIQKIAPDKYWDYAIKFASDIYPKCTDVACDLKESNILMNSLGIDSAAVLSCVKTEGDSLIEEDYNKAGINEVSGSPTLMINGVIANVARNAETYKGAICEAFSNVPSACSQTLSSDAATTSGSC